LPKNLQLPKLDTIFGQGKKMLIVTDYNTFSDEGKKRLTRKQSIRRVALPVYFFSERFSAMMNLFGKEES